MKKAESQSNLTSSPTGISGDRMIRGELNISSIDPTFDSVQVLNPYRFGLDLAVTEQSEVSNKYIYNHQIGIGFNDGFGTTGYQNIYCNG